MLLLLRFQASLDSAKSRRDHAATGVPSGSAEWWSTVNRELAGALSNGGGGGRGIGQGDYSRRRYVPRPKPSLHGARSDRSQTDSHLQPHESQFLRAWKLLSGLRPSGMIGLFLLGVPSSAKRRNAYCINIDGLSHPKSFLKWRPFKVTVTVNH